MRANKDQNDKIKLIQIKQWDYLWWIVYKLLFYVTDMLTNSNSFDVSSVAVSRA
jgi:hypothetical protein